MKMSPRCVESPRLRRAYEPVCVWASHDRVKNRMSGSEPYLPLTTLDWIKQDSVSFTALASPHPRTFFCFLDRRVLVCSPSKKADYISGGLKRPLVFQEGGPRLFPQCVEIFKTLAPLQENITCGSVCGKEEPVCQPSAATGPAGKPDRVTYLGFPCATTLGTALGPAGDPNCQWRFLLEIEPSVSWYACQAYRAQNSTHGWKRNTHVTLNTSIVRTSDFSAISKVVCARETSCTGTRLNKALIARMFRNVLEQVGLELYILEES